MAQPTKQAFETQEQFDQRKGLFGAQQRAALGFEQRQQALSGLTQQIAGLDPLQQQAQQRAVAGLGSFQPFLTQAQQLSGAGAGTGPDSVQAFMSPYQQQVIDTSLSEFDRQAAINRQKTRDAAVSSGAFGGGREGVQLAEQGARTAEARGRLQAGLLSDAFKDAVGRRQQAASDQMTFAQALPQFQRADVATLGGLGSLNQALAQAQKDADREATRAAAFMPQEQVDRYADIVTGIMGGMRGQGTQTTNRADPGILQSALAAAATGFGTGFLALNNNHNNQYTNDLLFTRTRGTPASPTAAQANDKIGGMTAQVWDGSAYQAGALVGFTTKSISSGNVGANFTISTRNGAIGTLTTKFEVAETGTVKMDTIESLTADTDLNISANGTGAVNISDVIVKLPNLPTSDPSVAGQLWRSGNDVKISTG